jgi:hypothetical protein
MANGEDSAGQILQGLIQAATDDRKDFIKVGKEISAYAYQTSSEDDDYKGFIPDGAPDVPFKARLAKMAQALDLFGPYLYPANPTRRVSPRPWSDQNARIRNKRYEDFLNYTPIETDLYAESLNCINEALCFGRGVMWTGFDDTKQLVCTVADTVENFLVDPDARTMKQINWKGRHRYKPRWEWSNKLPDQAAVINELPAGQERPSDKKGRNRDHASEIVKITEIYARVGLHHYGEGFVQIDKERGQGMADDAPRKYLVNGSKIVASMDWEVPFWRDGDWPCTELDLRERANRVWPNSPLMPGLCHQRALNWIYTTFINRMAKTNRKIFAVLDAGQAGANALSQDAIDTALYGPDLGVVKIPWNGQDDVDIRKVLQELTLSSGSEEFEKFYAVVSKEFEDATGLTPLLMSGDAGYQIRVSGDVDLKERSSKTRLNYYKDRVEKHQARIARKEALAAMSIQPREVLAQIFGAEAAPQFGRILSAGEIAHANAIMQTNPEMISPEDQAWLPFAIDFDKALREADYEIESGSMRAKTPEQAQDAAEMFMTRGLPALTSAGLMGPALNGMAEWARTNQMPDTFVQMFTAAAQQAEQQQQAAAQAQQQQAQQAAEAQKQQMAMDQQKMQEEQAHEAAMQQMKLQAQASLEMQKAKMNAAQKVAEKVAAPEQGESAGTSAPPVVVNLTVNNPALPPEHHSMAFDHQGGAVIVGPKT